MKILFIISILYVSLFQCTVSAQYKYWEQFTAEDKDRVFEDTTINETVKNYYLGNIKASDDSLTFRLLDIVTDKFEQNPLYFYVFNKIFFKADGALAEIMGLYCFKMLLNNPKYTINYFTLERLNSNSVAIERKYANELGFEFKEYGYIDEDSKMNYKDFKITLENVFIDDSGENKKSLSTLLKEIELTMMR